jgi:phage-related holin
VPDDLKSALGIAEDAACVAEGNHPGGAAFFQGAVQLDEVLGDEGLLIVVVANLADVLLELHYIRDEVIAAFSANESISILENAGLMGMRIPRVLTAALEKLSEEGEDGAQT